VTSLNMGHTIGYKTLSVPGFTSFLALNFLELAMKWTLEKVPPHFCRGLLFALGRGFRYICPFRKGK
jgi:hypothetical protein